MPPLRLRAWFLCCGLWLAFGAAATTVPPAEYGRLPAMDLPALSPSGRYVAFVATVEGQRRLMVMEPGSRTPLSVNLETGEAKLRGLAWAGDDMVLGTFSSTTRLAEGRDTDYELQGLFVIDRQSGAVRWPLRRDDILDAAFGLYGVHRIDGRWVVHVGVLGKQCSSSRAEWLRDGEIDLARIDLQSGEMSTLAAGQRHQRGWLLDSQGRVLAHSRFDAGARRWSLHAGAGNTPAIVEHLDPIGASRLHGLGRNEGSVVISLGNEQADAVLLEVALLPGAQPQPLAGSERFGSLWFSRTSGRLLGWRSKAHDAEPQFIDAADRARIDAVRRALPGYRLRYGSASDDNSRPLVFSQGHDDPGTWWLIDVPRGKADELEQARRADAPVLLVHGRDDTVVPIEQSRVMRRALQAAGKAVEMIELEGEDHFLSREKTRVATVEAVLAFVLRHNPAAAAP